MPFDPQPSLKGELLELRLLRVEGRLRYWIVLAFALCACGQRVDSYSAATADQIVTGTSALPIAVDPTRVGKYPGPAKSGAGYFYDEVLEYRVWLHPERGAQRLAGDNDYFAAFAEYERAVAFSDTTRGSETPLVLIRQLEWINEPTPGRYFAETSERITEWQVDWLKGAKRGPESIREFIASPPKRQHTNASSDSVSRPH
jgi:hypothetical protein